MSRCLRSALPLVLAACAACGGSSDPRQIDGVIRYMAVAIETDSPARLFRVIDARARHAMVSIVQDRRAAADVIRTQYPEPEGVSALAQLGDAARAGDAAALFAARCDSACRTTLAAKLAVPERVDGDELDVVVHTVRGTTLHFHRLAPGDWWGLIWHTQDLDTERARAAEELRTIEANAEVYARAEELERGAATREPAQ